MLSFNKRELTTARLDKWRDLGVNVLMIGEKGTGKTQNAIECFQRGKVKFAYFSASTLDPWIHVIGIPKLKSENGKDWLDFILPRQMDEDLEFIMIDEINRAVPIVRNALLELIQFKTINGRKFPKLKAIWAAINPTESSGGSVYDVHELDPAQLDRFHVIVETPNKPCLKYFSKKYGPENGKILVEWWNSQPTQALEILSPRRLDYIADYFLKGGDIGDIVPICCNHADLIKKLSMDEDSKLFNELDKSPNSQLFKEFVSNKNRALKYWDKLKLSKFWNLYEKDFYPELVDSLIKENHNFRSFCNKTKNSTSLFLKDRLKICGVEIESVIPTEKSSLIRKENPFKEKIEKYFSYNKRFEVEFHYLDSAYKVNQALMTTHYYRKGINGILQSLTQKIVFSKNTFEIYISFLTRAYKSMQKATIKNTDLELAFWSLAEGIKKNINVSNLRDLCEDLATNLEFNCQIKFNTHIQLIDYLRAI